MATRDMQTIDTNIVLSLLLNDEPSQKPRVKSLLLNGANYYVPTLVITEVIFMLERARKIKREKIVKSLTLLLQNSFIFYDNDTVDEALAYYLAHPKLSFNDCVISFETASRQREPLWTFDKDLAKQSPVAKLVL